MIFDDGVSKLLKNKCKTYIFFSISLIAVCQNCLLRYYEGESRHHPITFQTIDMGSLLQDKMDRRILR